MWTTMWTKIIKIIRHKIKLDNFFCKDSLKQLLQRLVLRLPIRSMGKKDNTDRGIVRLVRNVMGTRYKMHNNSRVHCETTSDAIILSVAHYSNSGLGCLIFKFYRYLTIRNTHTLGLLWTSEQLAAEFANHTTRKLEEYSCPQWDPNPQSQESSGSRLRLR